jgi:nucleotide-binding universal stress UspA family protein
MYKRILVPVAGGLASKLGLQEAVRFAKDQKARLRIAYVVDKGVLSQDTEAMKTTGRLLETINQ